MLSRTPGGDAISSLEFISEQVEPVEPAISAPDEPSPGDQAGRKRRYGGLIAIVLLSLALAAAVTTIGLYLTELDAANTRIEEQQRQLEEQHDLIEKKETFGAAMQALLQTAGEFDGVLMSTLVPVDFYESVAARAWSHRWDGAALDRHASTIRAATKSLEDLLEGAITRAATNSSGTTSESVIDQLSGGFVTSVIDDADTLCGADVVGCVSSDDPFTIHFDAGDDSEPYMTDWIRTGVAYHEFAHVLQMTNPEPTRIALEFFENDTETMADCFALTFLDGWTLDHKIWVSTYTYWEVSIGYGHVCTDVQRQAVRDWHSQLGFRLRPISQQS